MTELAKQIAALPAGAVFDIPAGVEDRPPILIRKPVTLRGSASTLGPLTVSGTSDVVLDGVSIRGDGVSGAVKITKCQRVTVTASTLTGAPATAGVDLDATPAAPVASTPVLGHPWGAGVAIDTSSAITLTGLDISDLMYGVSASHVDGLTVEGCKIHDLRTTPIHAGSLSNARIVGNHCWGIAPIRSGPAPDHFALIHLWTSKGDAVPAARILIASNVLDNGSSPVLPLGIEIEDNSGLGFTGLEVLGNVIIGSAEQGIPLEHVVGGRVIENVLVQVVGGVKDSPSILLRKPGPGWVGQPCQDLEIRGNICADRFGALASYPDNTRLPDGPHPPWLIALVRAGRLH